MRDAVLLICFLFGIGLTLRYPFAGILTWAWFSFMAPHQGIYSFGQTIAFNAIASIVAIGSLIIKGAPRITA